MIATRISALAVVAVLGVSAIASAQTPPPRPGGMAAPTWAPGSLMHHEAREAARLKALHDALNIRPDQEGAFQALAASMRPDDGGRSSGPMERGPQETSGMTTPERLDAMGRRMDEHMTRMRERFQRHASAVKALYAVLNPEQRRTLDALPDLMGHGMGMGMAMGSHHGMEHPGVGMEHPPERE
jgi:hypothetical protein